jgi:hypothetical protein
MRKDFDPAELNPTIARRVLLDLLEQGMFSRQAFGDSTPIELFQLTSCSSTCLSGTGF